MQKYKMNFEFQKEEIDKKRMLRSLALETAKTLHFEPTVDIMEDYPTSCSGVSSGVSHSDKFDFLPTEWLSKFFEDPLKSGEIETSKFFCNHNNLTFEKMSELKAVNCEAVNKNFNQNSLKFDVIKLILGCKAVQSFGGRWTPFDSRFVLRYLRWQQMSIVDA